MVFGYCYFCHNGVDLKFFKCSNKHCDQHICQTCISNKTPKETKWSFCPGTKGQRILDAKGTPSYYMGYCDKYTYILCPEHYGGEAWCESKGDCVASHSIYRPETIEPWPKKCEICTDLQEGVTTFGEKSKQIVLRKKCGIYKKRNFSK